MDKPVHWKADASMSDEALLALEAEYCSHGDTVHYTNPAKIFTGCEGSFMYDSAGREFLDLQMWYSAVNFGYRNERLNNAVRRQLDTLPQVASQYLHREKIELRPSSHATPSRSSATKDGCISMSAARRRSKTA